MNNSIAGIEVGETGPDWEPTNRTRYFAQCGKFYAFGPTPEAAQFELLAKHGDDIRCARYDADIAAQERANML